MSDILLMLDTSEMQTPHYNNRVMEMLKHLSNYTEFECLILDSTQQGFLVLVEKARGGLGARGLEAVELALNRRIGRGAFGGAFEAKDLLTIAKQIQGALSWEFKVLVTCGYVPKPSKQFPIDLYIPFGPHPEPMPTPYLIPPLVDGQEKNLARNLWQIKSGKFSEEKLSRAKKSIRAMTKDLGMS